MKVLLLTGFVFVVATLALAQNHSADEMKIIGMENLWNTAQRDHDTKAMEAMLADNFVDTEVDGTIKNRAEFLAMIKDPNIKHTLLSNTDTHVFYYGSTAIVQATFHDKGTDKGHPFDFQARFTDTWIESGGKWLCVASASTLVQKLQ